LQNASLDLGVNRRVRESQGKKRIEKNPELTSNHARRSEIYANALNLFTDKGYSGTSMSMIARALKMSKANLYYYCSSKEDLFYKIHLDYLQNNFIPIVEKAEQLPDPKARIDAILRGLALLNTSDRAVRVLIPDILNLHRDHHNEIVMIWRRAYVVVEK
jgi:AcrR family transcriptional regulator